MSIVKLTGQESTIHASGGWDPDYPKTSRLFDRKTGICIGTLQPVNHELVARSAGIQQWSKK